LQASSSNQSLVSQEDRGQEVAEVQKVESCSNKALIIILSECLAILARLVQISNIAISSDENAEKKKELL
jgi:hypothetical protein